MQAIKTKYLGPTNHKGGRLVVECNAKRVIVSWAHGLDVYDNHHKAACDLARDLGWLEHSDIYTGTLKSGDFVHVLVMKKEI